MVKKKKNYLFSDNKYPAKIIKKKKVKLAAANLAKVLIEEIPNEKDFYDYILQTHYDSDDYLNPLAWLRTAYKLLFESASKAEQETEKKFNLLIDKKYPSLLPMRAGLVHNQIAITSQKKIKPKMLIHQNFPCVMEASEKEIAKLKNQIKVIPKLKNQITDLKRKLDRITNAKNNASRIFTNEKKQTKPINKKSAKLKISLRSDYFRLREKGLTKTAAIENLKERKKYNNWTVSTINSYLSK